MPLNLNQPVTKITNPALGAASVVWSLEMPQNINLGALLLQLTVTKSATGAATKSIPAAALLFTGCAALQPGQRAVVVRAEQSISVADSTFDTVIHIDDANRSFFRTNAPAFHQFCEWLRTPVVMVPLTNSLPRGIAIVSSANAVKQTYKRTNATNDYAVLISSLAVVEAATSQAQKFILNQN